MNVGRRSSGKDRKRPFARRGVVHPVVVVAKRIPAEAAPDEIGATPADFCGDQWVIDEKSVDTLRSIAWLERLLERPARARRSAPRPQRSSHDAQDRFLQVGRRPDLGRPAKLR